MECLKIGVPKVHRDLGIYLGVCLLCGVPTLVEHIWFWDSTWVSVSCEECLKIGVPMLEVSSDLGFYLALIPGVPTMNVNRVLESYLGVGLMRGVPQVRG